MMKKYNFQSLNDVPSELLQYVKNVAGDDFQTISIQEVNELLNEVYHHISWPYQDSGLDG
jgi:hypothetical protein